MFGKIVMVGYHRISYFVVGSLPITNVAFFYGYENAPHTLKPA